MVEHIVAEKKILRFVNTGFRVTHYWVLVKVCRVQTHRAAQPTLRWWIRGSPLNEGLSGYITESLTVDHSRKSCIWRVPRSLLTKDLFCRFNDFQQRLIKYEELGTTQWVKMNNLVYCSGCNVLTLFSKSTKEVFSEQGAWHSSWHSMKANILVYKKKNVIVQQEDSFSFKKEI
jgi:hypothetical protein